jgi:hypothetical protein
MSKRSSTERHQGRQGRRINTRTVRQRFLIVCEGAQTEPNYFRAFRVPGLVVKIEDVHERGWKLVAKAEQLGNDDEYDQIWCVFDRDDLQPGQIEAAFQHAKQAKIAVAFSNQAFELWYLLHFDYHNTALTRQDYCERLEKKLGQYAKNSTAMYELLLDMQATAIANARRLHALYNPWVPAAHDPATTVYALVEELNNHRRP